MAKERLSQLQRWILLQCYNEGKYDGKYDNRESGSFAKVDYYIQRHELIVRQIDEYYKEYGKPEFTYQETVEWLDNEVLILHDQKKEKEAKNRIRNKLEVALTNSIKNLRKKGYITDLPIVEYPTEKLPPGEIWIGFQSWRWQGIWLTNKGIELAKNLIINTLF